MFLNFLEPRRSDGTCVTPGKHAPEVHASRCHAGRQVHPEEWYRVVYTLVGVPTLYHTGPPASSLPSRTARVLNPGFERKQAGQGLEPWPRAKTGRPGP